MNLSYKKQSGFTLIELLVVIGILGILAGTLFFAINPLEQLNRGNDAARKSAIEGFINGANGFYATQGMFPWDATWTTTCEETSGSSAVTTAPLDSGAGANCVTQLINAGEFRNSVTQDYAVLQDIFLTADDQSLAVCFAPQSTSEQTNANFAQDGTTGTGYWCIVQ